ncbi:MAG: hypothetical protein PWQ57_2068 [Desulfovibrionales bacterium]|nr:hypothetical protein [Desulfovibrionales bacterium]
MVSIAGILANPASGKDIRRLVAHGSVFDNQEKVRMTRRLILGMERGGVERIVYMPDAYGVVERALSAISPAIPVTPLETPMRNTQQDTTTAAEIMETLGVACMVVLGGDGTSRAACKGTVNVPILPLSTGTNNVFPFMGEATIAGLAAGVTASGKLPIEQCCVQVCMFDILRNQEVIDIALVDAAVYDDVFMASRAVWRLDKVPQLFLTRCRADSIGLSAIGGQLRSIRPEEPRGLALELGEPADASVTAAIAPGMFATVGVRGVKEMLPDEIHPIHTAPGMIAVDGEREVDIHRGDAMAIRLNTAGPKVVDVRRVMDLSRKRGLFVR